VDDTAPVSAGPLRLTVPKTVTVFAGDSRESRILKDVGATPLPCSHRTACCGCMGQTSRSRFPRQRRCRRCSPDPGHVKKTHRDDLRSDDSGGCGTVWDGGGDGRGQCAGGVVAVDVNEWVMVVEFAVESSSLCSSARGTCLSWAWKPPHSRTPSPACRNCHIRGRRNRPAETAMLPEAQRRHAQTCPAICPSLQLRANSPSAYVFCMH
jgi:hypothetical protein